jgi:oxygen-dependent protoporphyrinogen oxidase
VGGAIGVHRDGDWLHELGPNSLLEGSTEVAKFIDAVGLGPRRLYAAETAKNRYIVRGGKLRAMPTSPGKFLGTPLFSWGAKLGLAGEVFRGRGDYGRDESVADFVVRRLGREFLDYAINPFVAGVYAGDPRRLSVQHAFPKLHALEREHRSLLLGAIARRNPSGGPKGRIFSFPEGLGELPRTIAQALGSALRLRSAVRALRCNDASWEIEFEKDGALVRETASAVVCALPADALAAIRFENVPRAAELAVLREIEHPPVASVFMGFRRADVGHPLDGFGVLVPEVERARILGALFSSTLFPGRAPKKHVAITTFVGGTRQPDLARLPEPELGVVVQEELGRYLSVRAAPVYVHVQRWPRAIPQYTVGYQRFKDVMTAVEQAAPGLFIGGNARDGISLANCIESGRRVAREVAAAGRGRAV